MIYKNLFTRKRDKDYQKEVELAREIHRFLIYFLRD